MSSMLQLFADIVIRPGRAFTDIGSRHLILSYAVLVIAGITKAFRESYTQVVDASEPAFHPGLMMSGVIMLMCLSILVGAMLWATLLNASSSIFNPYDEWPQLRVGVPLALLPSIMSDVMAMILGPGWVLFWIQIASAIWAAALYVIMVSVVKEISLLKAFLSVLIAALVVVALIALVGFLIAVIFTSSTWLPRQ